MKRSPAAAQPKYQREAKDMRLARATQPTTQPRPDWMNDSSKLPRPWVDHKKGDGEPGRRSRSRSAFASS
jgi:hypothetical protein